jgi:hypothetical protein
MKDRQKEEYDKIWRSTFRTLITSIKFFLVVIIGVLLYIPLKSDINKWLSPKKEIVYDAPLSNQNSTDEEDVDPDLVENGIHVATGLAFAPGFEDVRANCIVCHSAALVTQNRATREGWDQMLDWMQKTQGLWELGPKRARILDYLAKNYAPKAQGRRASIDLEEVEWYILDLD